MLEEEVDPVLGAALRGLADAVHEPAPALRVRRLERVVVALDPRPDDEVRAERPCHVGGGQRAAAGFCADLRIRVDEAAAAEERIEVEPGGDAVDAVAAERLAHLVEVLLGELLRVMELVVVDQVAEPVDRPPHALDRGLAGVLRLVAARHEPRDHGPQRPDAQARLHASAPR